MSRRFHCRQSSKKKKAAIDGWFGGDFSQEFSIVKIGAENHANR